jgi:DNA-binding FrmR family transcriptional regulator
VRRVRCPRSDTHVLRDKRGLVNRVRRLRGQVDAIERALQGESSCSDLLQRITAARGAINGLMAEVLLFKLQNTYVI